MQLARWCEVRNLFDGEMGELDDPGAILDDDGDQTRTG
jgi:hypothetical protein